MSWYVILTLIVSVLMSLLMAYHFIVGLFAFRIIKRPGPSDRLHRFALVVAARNEEAVIGCLLDSLHAQDYPREAFDIFVIADNCTDRTGDVAAAAGAQVYTRQNQRQVGKGFALGWFFQQFLPQYGNRYDAIGIFDADNLVEPDYLAEMNRQLGAGQVAVMGFRDSKNAGDNIIATTAAMSFWLVARFYHHPRQVLRLMVPAGGTGFVFLTRLIASGWNTETMQEDMEFTIKLAMSGQRIGYTPYARFYDEQPVSLLPSLRQRLRWAVGGFQNLRLHLPRLLGSLKNGHFFLVLDTLIFLISQPAFGFQLLVGLLCLAGAMIGVPVESWGSFLLPLLYSSLIGLATLYLQSALVLLKEKKFSWKLFIGALFFPAYLVSNVVIFFLAMFIRKVFWHPVTHRRALNLKQVSRR
ncbi:MAG TPA: hypothetical protein DD640_04710 [Clostridiales bacterium]|nr:hypothetical protein [Clostridiales bacterium]